MLCVAPEAELEHLCCHISCTTIAVCAVMAYAALHRLRRIREFKQTWAALSSEDAVLIYIPRHTCLFQVTQDLLLSDTHGLAAGLWVPLHVSNLILIIMMLDHDLSRCRVRVGSVQGPCGGAQGSHGRPSWRRPGCVSAGSQHHGGARRGDGRPAPAAPPGVQNARVSAP